MSAPQEGMHLAREAQRLTEKMRDGVVTGEVTAADAQGGAVAGQFQRKITAYDRMDDEMNTKLQLMDNQGMTPFGQVYYDERVGKWLQRKAAAAETANLDTWFNKEYNKNDLASRQLAQELYPEFYESRKRELLDRMQEVYNLKMIELVGPQSKEDMYKLWLINTGRVVLPPDWDRIGADPTAGKTDSQRASWNQQTFKQGLVRMPLFSTKVDRDQNAIDTRAAGMPIANPQAAPNYFSWGTTGTTQNEPLVSDSNNTFSKVVLGKIRQQ
jgi:hypothetical protein